MGGADRSQRLRLTDIRSVWRVVHECLELWDDPQAWRLHLLTQGARVCGSETAALMDVRLNPRDPRAWASPEARGVGFRDERAVLDRARRDIGRSGPESMPGGPELIAAIRTRGWTAFCRQELMDRDAWERCDLYQRFRRPAGLDEMLVSAATDGQTAERFWLFGFDRHPGDRPFPRRSRTLALLLAREVAPLIGTRLTLEGQPSRMGLSPRRREALDLLLEGLSEKEMAAAMGISPHTARQYADEICRHFGVRSRPQLMAYFIRQGRRQA